MCLLDEHTVSYNGNPTPNSSLVLNILMLEILLALLLPEFFAALIHFFRRLFTSQYRVFPPNIPDVEAHPLFLPKNP